MQIYNFMLTKYYFHHIFLYKYLGEGKFTAKFALQKRQTDNKPINSDFE
jgi:hypothetical protein